MARKNGVISGFAIKVAENLFGADRDISDCPTRGPANRRRGRIVLMINLEFEVVFISTLP
ncbi:hypothetical protein AWV80_27805 [Cupriavidus sp. UYMU48A]|nr:hypothetical protein AWV80_27805 [Cupriavidus sp. UYMU48A]